MKLFFLCLLVYMLGVGWSQRIPLYALEVPEDFENVYVQLLAQDSLSSSFLIVVKKEVKLHKHLYHSEHVYVLEGAGEMQLGEKWFSVHAGDVIFIPKNTLHKVLTTSKIPLKVLSIQSPYFDGSDRILLE